MNEGPTERALRRSLRAQGDSVTARPDTEILLTRVDARAARSGRWFAAVAVVVVVVGAAVGFALGGGSGQGDATSTIKVASGDSSSAAVDPATNESGRSVAAPSGPAGLTKLFIRTTADGITIRVYVSPSVAPTCADDCPAPACASRGVLVVEASTDRAVDHDNLSWYLGPPTSFVVATRTFGVREATPVWWYEIHVGADAPGAQSVQARFANGTDAMDITRGEAVLAARTDAPGGTADILDKDGRVLRTLDLATSGEREFLRGVDCGSSGTVPASTPQPAVTVKPATPGPQPSDLAGAKAGVIQAFTDLMTGSNSNEVKDAATEAIDEIRPLRVQSRAVGAAAIGDSGLANLNVAVANVTFTDETHATVVYTLKSGSTALLSNRTGYAVFVDGRWKVGVRTTCENMKVAGITCPPDLLARHGG